MHTIEYLLKAITDKALSKKCLSLYDVVEEEFNTRPSSIKHHHVDAGGMGRHVKEVMNNALEFYALHPEWYDTNVDEVTLVSFVHDLDKIGRYIPNTDEWKKKKFNQLFDYNSSYTPMNPTAKTVQMCAQHGIILTDVQIQAVSLHHGGFSVDLSSVYSSMKGVLPHPLSVLLHTADYTSSHVTGRKAD